MDKQKANTKHRAGFTIVELLIVIVVIAILAAISIVLYVNIQTKASNTQSLAAATAYAKAINLYVNEKGHYPRHTNKCLGADYDNERCVTNIDGLNRHCFGIGPGINRWIQNDDFNAEIAPYMGGTLSSPSKQVIECNGTQYVGAYYSHSPAGAQYPYATMYLILKGRVDCTNIGGVRLSQQEHEAGGTECQYGFPVLR